MPATTTCFINGWHTTTCLPSVLDLLTIAILYLSRLAHFWPAATQARGLCRTRSPRSHRSHPSFPAARYPPRSRASAVPSSARHPGAGLQLSYPSIQSVTIGDDVGVIVLRRSALLGCPFGDELFPRGLRAKAILDAREPRHWLPYLPRHWALFPCCHLLPSVSELGEAVAVAL